MRELADRREGPRERARGTAAAHRAQGASLPAADPAIAVVPVHRLRGSGLQSFAGALQRSIGNRAFAGWLAAVQRQEGASSGTGTPTARRPTEVTIEVLSARINEKPSFIARAVAVVSRGDRLTTSGERRGGWHQVATPEGRPGWIHESAWVTQKPSLSSAPGAGGSREEPEEIEIGGRG